MNKVVFLRHGLSTWNLENRFTGWTDVDLAPQGYDEAREAARQLKENGYEFDCVYTSLLKRAIRTLWLVMDDTNQLWLPVHKDWRLNERHYGALQGLNKKEVAEHYGDDQVHQWRRGFDIRPPALEPSDPRLPSHDRRYAGIDADHLPNTESLADTMHRCIECWEQRVRPSIEQGRRVLLVAHNNTLRAIIKHLEGISDEEIMKVEIPTGVPLVYEFNDQLQVLTRYYLHEAEQARAVGEF